MTVNELVLQIIKMAPAYQFDIAFKIAENLGYELVKEPSEVTIRKQRDEWPAAKEIETLEKRAEQAEMAVATLARQEFLLRKEIKRLTIPEDVK